MMNNKIMKLVGNTIGVAAIAALGITAYQLGMTPVKEEVREEQEIAEEKQDKPSMIDAETKNVEAEMKYKKRHPEPGKIESKGTVFEAKDELKKKELLNTEKKSKKDNESEETNVQNLEVDYENEKKDEEKEDKVKDVSASVSFFPEVNFSEETLMEWPVRGNILVDYSMDQTTYFPTLDQYRLSPAISVQAVEGAPVMAAANGKVLTVEQKATTGTTVTMELGNGYQAIYGQLAELQVAEGDTVKKGTIIGYIGEPTKYYTMEGSNLYFAMKKDGEPIDPITYLP